MPEPMNTERLLGELSKLRSSMPVQRNRRIARPRKRDSERMNVRSVEEFERETLADALETLADEVRGIVEAMEQDLYEQALDVYYAAVELARDPEHAHLIEHVEKMQSSHLAQYGKAVPSKEETERRRSLSTSS